MANKELVTCDYEGCDKPFAYRLGPFNLCPRHLYEGSPSWRDELREYSLKLKGKDEISSN